MKLALAALFALLVAPALAQERPPVPPKFYASAAEVEQLIAKARAEHKSDTANTIEILVSDGPYPVQLELRTGNTAPALHRGQAELIYVIDGACTLVTGGTLNGQRGAGPTILGDSLTGGTPRRVAKGDYIMVPPDTPHWYSAPEKQFIIMTVHMPMTAQ